MDKAEALKILAQMVKPKRKAASMTKGEALAILASMVEPRDVVSSSEPGLVILSSGLGRDSSTMVALMLEGRLPVAGRMLGPSDVDAVVFSDTGYEWSFTYRVMESMIELLRPAGVPFYALETPPEHVWRPWWQKRRKAWLQSFAQVEAARDRGDEAKANRLWENLARSSPRGQIPWRTPELLHAPIQVKARSGYYHNEVPLLQRVMERSRPVILRRAGGGRSAECTGKHKIEPIRRFASDLVAKKYPEIQKALKGPYENRGGKSYLKRKDHRGHRIGATDPLAALKLYAADVKAGRVGPIQMLVGYAADEMNRVKRGEEGIAGAPEYVRIAIDERYPLVEAGVGKKQEGQILSRYGLDWIRKSGCMFCPESPASWFWALSEWDRAFFDRLVDSERQTMRRNPKFTWLGGKKTLPQIVSTWRERNPHATMEEVLDKTYSRCGAFNRCSTCGS